MGLERPAGGAGLRQHGVRTDDLSIRDQLREFSANINVMAPAALIQMIVPLIVFFAFKRYFVQGLLAGSVK